MDQGDQHPVGEHQPVLAARPGGTVTLPAPPLMQCRFPPGLRRPGQLLDKTAEMCTRDVCEGRMGQGRTAHFLVTLEEPVRPSPRHGL